MLDFYARVEFEQANRAIDKKPFAVELNRHQRRPVRGDRILLIVVDEDGNIQEHDLNFHNALVRNVEYLEDIPGNANAILISI